LDPQARIAQLEAEVAAKDARIAELEAQVAELTKKVAQLLALLGQNSRNSNKPPSSDPPGAGGGSGKPAFGRPRGGQKGHKGNSRSLLPESQVNEFKDHFPPECESCWKRLPEVPDPRATRFQSIEVPPIKPFVVEHRYHGVTCTCGYTTRRKCDVAGSPFGPRLMGIIGLFSGIYHISRRKSATLLSDLLGIEISLGALSAVEERVSDAVKTPVEAAWDMAHKGDVKNADGTDWVQSGKTCSLWTLATAAVTVFKIIANSSKATLQPIFGGLKGILISDRATALNFWAMERRQICWAHLLRKFVSFSERDGPAAVAGRELLEYVGVIFDYWHAFKARTISRIQLAEYMRPVQTQVEACLTRMANAQIPEVSGSCTNMLEHKLAMWTFVAEDGVEPTNNHAERELRAFVLWRKRSFGTQSDRGNLFAERLMTVAHTARKQKKNVFEFLTACCRASLDGTAAPSLFPPALSPSNG
jgi:transposase